MREESFQTGQLKSHVLVLGLISPEDNLTSATSPALPLPLDPVRMEPPLTLILQSNPSQAWLCLREKSSGLWSSRGK